MGVSVGKGVCVDRCGWVFRYNWTGVGCLS